MPRAENRDLHTETINAIVSGEELRRIRQGTLGTTRRISMRKDRIPKQLTPAQREQLQQFSDAHRVPEGSDFKEFGPYHIAQRIYELLDPQELSERLISPRLERAHAESSVDNIIVAGTSCSGKNVHAPEIAAALGSTFIDVDDLVSGLYLRKLKNGPSPTTEDRLAVYITALNIMHLMNETGRKVVMTYPAQKEVYRNLLRTAGNVRFVFLHAPENVLLERAKSRHHPIIRGDACEPFIRNQVRILEMPTETERADTVSVSTDAPEDQVQKIIEKNLRQWAFPHARRTS